MSDITELFRQVAEAGQEPSSDIVDADLARGQQALVQFRRRRRARRSIAGVAAVAGIAAVVTVVQLQGSSAPQHATANGPGVDRVVTHPSNRTHGGVTAVRLVAYTGQQPAGFTVDQVPEGWQLQGSTPYALTIAPHGDTNTDPDVFEGKLTVLLQSQSASGLPKGQPVTVSGQAGVVSDQGKYGLVLTYPDGLGHTVVVQAPQQLNWSNDQLTTFAAGVHVTQNAKAGVG